MALSRSKNGIVVGIPLVLMASVIVLARSTWFQRYPQELSVGITLDLMLTIPVIYFLIIRKKKIPKITVLSLSVAGMLIAGYILPTAYQSFLTQLKTFFFPAIELAVLSYISFKLYKVLQQYRIQKEHTPDFYTALHNTCKEIFPGSISTVLTTEIAVIYYAFIHWRKRTKTENEFYYHKKSGTPALLYAIIFILITETIILHLVLQQWNNGVAWVLSALGIYACFQIFALIRSMPKRPITITWETQKLMLRYGFFSETTIVLDSIKQVELSSRPLPDDKSIIPFSPLRGLDSHNVIIHLETEHILNGFYGMKKTYKSIAIYVDEKEKFKETLCNAFDKIV